MNTTVDAVLQMELSVLSSFRSPPPDIAAPPSAGRLRKTKHKTATIRNGCVLTIAVLAVFHWAIPQATAAETRAKGENCLRWDVGFDSRGKVTFDISSGMKNRLTGLGKTLAQGAPGMGAEQRGEAMK
jgi:hypothetical protein